MDCNLHETIVSTVDIVPASWNAIMTYEELIKMALLHYLWLKGTFQNIIIDGIFLEYCVAGCAHVQTCNSSLTKFSNFQP